ncbi:unnamed protein product [Cyprideis torosa]|uniref:Pre-mRNA-processing factor 19 n=1 Tax=Cyprideis torosa TaxID=163714 RepID=A0A7R8WN29_9CRUS|nr:unnamed protein product [Cyprideis torosa]CAG0904292.1 unnamed protein product [Cyprideis torosa]
MKTLISAYFYRKAFSCPVTAVDYPQGSYAPTGHSGEITSISFSENGYYLATSAEDACVKLWDLRKLKNFKTIALEEPNYSVKDLCFDQSGAYLAVAGSDVRIYLCKQWQELNVFNDHTAMATGVRFGQRAQFLASVSMDRTLKLYGLPGK